jgi:hypothetical protein
MVCPFIVLRPRAVVLAVIGSVVLAQAPLEAQGLGALARQNHTRGLLWKVESATPGPDAAVLYLAGSIHALGRTAYPLAPSFDQAFEASTTLVEEIDLLETPDEVAGAALLAKAQLKPGRTLEQSLSPPTYQRLTAFTSAARIPLAKLSELKPWAVAVMLSSLVAVQIGLDPALGLDRHFLERARARQLTVVGLETMDQQLDFFDKLPQATQDQMLAEALTSPEKRAQHLSEMVTTWRKGEADALGTMVEHDFADAPAAFASLIVQRNRNWMPTIDKCLAGMRCFVVVGAAHLVGPDGLVAMLRVKGYRVTQL